ncbi:hypothetical protein HK101_005130 [Irineochytrium annulatum]|nr:hypothetical protein HK101_005130 [Irineochytrium annulatum]
MASLSRHLLRASTATTDSIGIACCRTTRPPSRPLYGVRRCLSSGKPARSVDDGKTKPGSPSAAAPSAAPAAAGAVGKPGPTQGAALKPEGPDATGDAVGASVSAACAAAPAAAAGRKPAVATPFNADSSVTPSPPPSTLAPAPPKPAVEAESAGFEPGPVRVPDWYNWRPVAECMFYANGRPLAGFTRNMSATDVDIALVEAIVETAPDPDHPAIVEMEEMLDQHYEEEERREEEEEAEDGLFGPDKDRDEILKWTDEEHKIFREFRFYTCPPTADHSFEQILHMDDRPNRLASNHFSEAYNHFCPDSRLSSGGGHIPDPTPDPIDPPIAASERLGAFRHIKANGEPLGEPYTPNEDPLREEEQDWYLYEMERAVGKSHLARLFAPLEPGFDMSTLRVGPTERELAERRLLARWQDLEVLGMHRRDMWITLHKEGLYPLPGQEEVALVAGEVADFSVGGKEEVREGSEEGAPSSSARAKGDAQDAEVAHPKEEAVDEGGARVRPPDGA